FALRARSAEAKLQVELAQLEYSLPRLKNLWTHLEKFRGGIGVRGPGETQLESDRRLVAHRIRLLKTKLGDVQRSRAVQRQSRRGTFRAALVGYTNAGKSSILKAMSGANDVFVEDRLFATLDPLTREVSLEVRGEGETVRGEGKTVRGAGNSVRGAGILLTDTVGFIRKLPHHLVASFRATLDEVREASLLLHVIDAAHPAWEEQRLVVDDVLAEIGAHETPVLHLFNKIDLLESGRLAALRERMANLRPDAVFVSAATKDGLDPLRAALLAATRRDRPVVELRVPAGDGALLARIHRESEVLSTRSDDTEMVLTVRASGSELERLRALGAR
ncbi:MAG TPA: GTPase HflX, partial [Gemmatimonadaceae bacterium]